MKKIFSIFMLCAAVLVVLSGCHSDLAANTVHSVSDVNGKTVGVLAESETSKYLEQYGEKINIKYYSSVDAMAADLKAGILDCIAASDYTAEKLKKSEKHVAVLSEPLLEEDYNIAVSLDSTVLLANINSSLKKMAENGTFEKIESKWLKGSEKYEVPEKETGEVLPVAVCLDFNPYAFYDEDGNAAGLEVDIAKAICADLGFVPEFYPTDEANLLYMAESGKVSFAIGRITEDENSNVLYTDKYLTSIQRIVVRDN